MKVVPFLAFLALAAPLHAQVVQGQSTFAVEPQPLMRQFQRLALPYVPNWFGAGTLQCEFTIAVHPVDVDADGDLDLVVGPHGRSGARLLLNDGPGRFTEVTATHMPSSRDLVYKVSPGDIDGDGDLDLVFGTNHHGIWVFINDGSGRFTDETWRIQGNANFQYPVNDAAIVADFDGDNDLDIVRSGGRYSALYRVSGALLTNDGAGRFTESSGAFPQDGGIRSCMHSAFHAVDFDADGDIDILGNAQFGGISCWINDGTGTFTDGTTTRFSPAPMTTVFLDVAIADVDGDGDIDLAASRAYSGRVPPFLFLNDGRGFFRDVTATHVPAEAMTGTVVQFADLDGDGDQDLLIMVPTLPRSPYTGEEQVLLNDGTGRFRLDAARTVMPRDSNGGCFGVVTADLDGDGDIEVVLDDGGAGNAAPCRMRYYTNTLRHLHAPSAPARGALWLVTVFGPARGQALVAIALSSATTPLPPLGTFHLDPLSTVVWPSLLQLDNERRATLAIPIPALPLLAGIPVYAQAVVDDRAGTLRLTNLWVEDAIR